MGNQSAFFFVGQSEIIGKFRQLSLRNRSELPMREERRIFASGAREAIGAQNLGRVVRGSKLMLSRWVLP